MSGSAKSRDVEALDGLDFALGLGTSSKSKLATAGGGNKVSMDLRLLLLRLLQPHRPEGTVP